MEPATTMLAAACGGWLAWTLWENAAHRRRLARLPLRIHVNGTRGKSSVTRLTAAGLRAGGRKIFAKTTGTTARMIFPDGRDEPILRLGGADVIEQVACVKAAVECGAEGIVFECMALDPNLQSLCELKLLRSYVGIITNVRADHLDVMGPTSREVARALAGTVPVGGVLYTAEERFAPILERAARDRGSRCVVVGSEDCAALDEADLDGFGYLEHRENLALALRVCLDLGVDRRAALEAMWATEPDPGVLTVDRRPGTDVPIHLMNAFAANDPDSTARLWSLALARFPQARYKIAVINCRADRPDRSRQFGEACGTWLTADRCVLMGTGTEIARQAARKAGCPARRLESFENRPAGEVLTALLRTGGESAVIVGMGNIGGQGMELVRRFRLVEAPSEPAPSRCLLQLLKSRPPAARNA